MRKRNISVYDLVETINNKCECDDINFVNLTCGSNISSVAVEYVKMLCSFKVLEPVLIGVEDIYHPLIKNGFWFEPDILYHINKKQYYILKKAGLL